MDSRVLFIKNPARKNNIRAGLLRQVGSSALGFLVALRCARPINHRSVVAEQAEDVQQTQEQVVDGDIQGDGCHDVVGFAAVHDLAGLK